MQHSVVGIHSASSSPSPDADRWKWWTDALGSGGKLERELRRRKFISEALTGDVWLALNFQVLFP